MYSNGFFSAPTTKYSIESDLFTGTTITDNLEDKVVESFPNIYFEVITSRITGESHIAIWNTETDKRENIFGYESIYEVLGDFTGDEMVYGLYEEEQEYQEELESLENMAQEILGEDLYNWAISKGGKPSVSMA